MLGGFLEFGGFSWFCVGFLVFGLMGCCLFMVIDECVCGGFCWWDWYMC